MKSNIKFSLLSIVIIMSFALGCKKVQTESNNVNEEVVNASPLPSWNEGKSKQAIIDFVTKTTKEGSPDFVPVADRIACFDNDGTLWTEQPMPFQLLFVMDRIKAMASQHPEWKTTQPYKAVLESDIKALMSGGQKALLQIVMATHSGMTTDEFSTTVKDWMATATHPKTGKQYNEMVYQPMLELLDFLRKNNYKTYIVSGGGVDFMRVWAEETYGIPPYQVIGSSGKVKYELVNDKPTLVKLPEINFNDDKEGKPVAIHQYIGKRPIFTVGNSDGDYAMLQYTSNQSGPHFGMIIQHTDSEREWAYDRNSSIGHLEKGLDDAAKYEWQIVNMKQDWNKVYPFEK